MGRNKPKPVRAGRCRARAVRTRPDGRWYWRAEVYDAATGMDRKLGTMWGTRGEALDWVVELAGRGSSAPVEQPEPVEIRTVGKLLDAWLGTEVIPRGAVGELAPNTVHNYRARVRRITELVGSRALTGSPTRLWDHYRLTQLKRRAPLTVAGDLSTLGAAWRWARDVGIVHADVPRCRGGTPQLVREKYTPTESEVRKLLARVNPDTRSGLTVHLTARLGCRPVGLRRLRWRDVDLDRRELRLDEKGKVRTVPMIRQVRELLESRVGEPDAYVCAAAARTIGAVLVRACAAAGVPRMTPYSLRRYAVDRLYEVSGPAVAAAILGHSPVVAMTHYHRVRPADKLAALEAALGDPEEAKVVEGPWGKTPHR